MKLRHFSGLSPRNLRIRVQRTLLTAIGIVLGVGIVFGVLTLSETMSGAFGNLFSRAFGANGFEVAFYYPIVPALLSILSGLLIGLLPARANIVEAIQYE
ncbi:hypothetical protein BH24ACT19_BH24ACT19_07380 [soil metagenome]|jgi:hypothetical protein